MRLHPASRNKLNLPIVAVSGWQVGLNDVSIGTMDAESPTAEHYRKAAKEIRQVTQRLRFRGIGDESFDLAERCDRMGLHTKETVSGGHVGLLRSISAVILV